MGQEDTKKADGVVWVVVDGREPDTPVAGVFSTKRLALQFARKAALTCCLAGDEEDDGGDEDLSKLSLGDADIEILPLTLDTQTNAKLVAIFSCCAETPDGKVVSEPRVHEYVFRGNKNLEKHDRVERCEADPDEAIPTPYVWAYSASRSRARELATRAADIDTVINKLLDDAGV